MSMTEQDSARIARASLLIGLMELTNEPLVHNEEFEPLRIELKKSIPALHEIGDFVDFREKAYGLGSG